MRRFKIIEDQYIIANGVMFDNGIIAIRYGHNGVVIHDSYNDLVISIKNLFTGIKILWLD